MMKYGRLDPFSSKMRKPDIDYVNLRYLQDLRKKFDTEILMIPRKREIMREERLLTKEDHEFLMKIPEDMGYFYAWYEFIELDYLPHKSAHLSSERARRFNEVASNGRIRLMTATGVTGNPFIRAVFPRANREAYNPLFGKRSREITSAEWREFYRLMPNRNTLETVNWLFDYSIPKVALYESNRGIAHVGEGAVWANGSIPSGNRESDRPFKFAQ